MGLEEPDAVSLEKLIRAILIESPQRFLVRLWQRDWIPVVAGIADPDTYIDDGAPYRRARADAARILPEGQRVLFVGEIRTFYFANPVLAASPMDEHPIKPILQRATSLEDVSRGLAELRVGAILFRPGEYQRLTGDRFNQVADRAFAP